MKSIHAIVATGIAAAICFLSQVSFAQYQISSCPYKADVKNGSYVVVGTVWGGGGDCIDITAPGVTVLFNNNTVYSGRAAIHIEKSAKHAHLIGPGYVFNTILDEGDSAIIEDLTVGFNGPGSAIVLKNVRDSVVRGDSAEGGNGEPDVWLDNTMNCTVENNRALGGGGSGGQSGIIVTNTDSKVSRSRNNLIANNDVRGNGIGIYIDGVGPTCTEQVPSEGNTVTENVADDNLALGSFGIGILLGCGARDTTVSHNTGLHNWNYDALDLDLNCKANTWRDNKFRNAYPSCIVGSKPELTVLHAFQGFGDGENPTEGLTVDMQSNLYGTVPYGGDTGCGDLGCGYAFKMSRTDHGWKKTKIHVFTGAPSDGMRPSSGLIFDESGNLYGETLFGGAVNAGTVYKLSPNSGGGWTEQVLFSFAHTPLGINPNGGLIFDQSGNLYGVAGGGLNCGVVFELTRQSSGIWTERLAYSFKPEGGDGIQPNGGLAFDPQGNLFGSTYLGGANGEGTVFELTPQQGSWRETVIHSFANDENGRSPLGGVVTDNIGNVFGTTWRAGSADAGTAFELSPGAAGNWNFKLLHAFKGEQDTGFPVASMIFDSAGNLYGTEEGDGYNWPSVGSVFRLTPEATGEWKEVVLHRFGGGPDGGYPIDSLAIDMSGNLYGTANDGGNSGCWYGCGVIFEVPHK